MLVLRSALFSVVMMLATFFYSFLCVLVKPFSIKIRYPVITAWTAFIIWAAKVICGITYEVIGEENIPKEHGILFSKHQSTWETFFLPTHFHQPAIILKKELLNIPFFGWGLSIIDPIAIDRKDKQSAMDQIIAQGSKMLKEGRHILYFPEGTRTKPGAITKYKTGGARLAIAAGCPLIPIALNSGTYWPRKGFLKKPGTVKVVIGPPIYPDHQTPQQLVEAAQLWIEGKMKEIQ